VSTNNVATAAATTNTACTNTAALNTNVVVHWIQWKRPSAVAQRLSLRRETRPNDPHSRRKIQCQDTKAHLVHRSLLYFLPPSAWRKNSLSLASFHSYCLAHCQSAVVTSTILWMTSAEIIESEPIHSSFGQRPPILHTHIYTYRLLSPTRLLVHVSPFVVLLTPALCRRLACPPRY
jgi:hypothetical protein